MPKCRFANIDAKYFSKQFLFHFAKNIWCFFIPISLPWVRFTWWPFRDLKCIWNIVRSSKLPDHHIMILPCYTNSLWSWWPEDHMWPPVLPPMQEGPQLGGFYGHQQSGDTERWHFEKLLSFCDNFCEFTSYYWSMSSQIMLQTSCQGQSLGLQPHKINCEHLQGDLDSVRVIPISVPKRKNSQHPTTFFDRNRIYCNSSRGWLLGLFSFCYWGAGTKTPCMISNNM